MAAFGAGLGARLAGTRAGSVARDPAVERVGGRVLRLAALLFGSGMEKYPPAPKLASWSAPRADDDDNGRMLPEF